MDKWRQIAPSTREWPWVAPLFPEQKFPYHLPRILPPIAYQFDMRNATELTVTSVSAHT